MSDFEIEGKRILEIGCGLALSSLLLNHRQANITATDYNPAAGTFLKTNAKLNENNSIPFICTDWADKNTGMGKFDLIIGSDLLYEDEQIELLSTFISRHTNDHCEVILVDPGRGLHARFSKKMVRLGYAHSQSQPTNTEYLSKPFKGQVLRYQCR